MKMLATLFAAVGLTFSAVVMTVPVAVGATSDRPLVERIRLRGSVCLSNQPCAEAIAVAAAAPAAAAGPRSGEEVYTAACAACHAGGVMGAPKYGDKGLWASRLPQGKPTLYEHAIKGYNAMPAKGGCATCSDDDIKAAVDHMVAAVQ